MQAFRGTCHVSHALIWLILIGSFSQTAIEFIDHT